MVHIEITCEKDETRKDVYEALGTFLLKFILDETRAAYEHAYNQGYEDGMKEAVTTTTE